MTDDANPDPKAGPVEVLGLRLEKDADHDPLTCESCQAALPEGWRLGWNEAPVLGSPLVQVAELKERWQNAATQSAAWRSLAERIRENAHNSHDDGTPIDSCKQWLCFHVGVYLRHFAAQEWLKDYEAAVVAPWRRALEWCCPDCEGAGFTVDAHPLPSGEPGEPFQVQCFHPRLPKGALRLLATTEAQQEGAGE